MLHILALRRRSYGLAPLIAVVILLLAVTALVMLPQRSSNPVSASAGMADVLREASARASALKNYAVNASVVVRYADGTERLVRGEYLFKFRDQPYDVSTGDTGVERGVIKAFDPMIPLLRVDGTSRMSPQTVLNRQPGQWAVLSVALWHLVNTPDIAMVGEEEIDGLIVVHYRAKFPHRPDLELFRPYVVVGSDSQEVLHEEPLLKKEIYETAAQTVDAWIGKSDLLVRRIETVTTGLAYPAFMPEPNDLRDAVEERVTLTFSDFDRISAERFELPTAS